MRHLFVVFLALISTCATAQKLPEPVLRSASVPFYPPEARVTNVQGNVIVGFDVQSDGTVKNVHRVAGLPVLADAAVENVRTWRFEKPDDFYQTKWDCTAEFSYVLSKTETEHQKLGVTFDNYHKVEVTVSAPITLVQ